MSDKEDLMKPESRQEYEADRDRYYRNVGSPKTPGISADDLRIADAHLPPLEQRLKHAERLEKGFTKTSRSGAFTDKPNASAAIFPNGLKFASDFVDEHTPKGWKPPAPMKPRPTQEKPTGNAPKPKAILDRCPSCMAPVDPKAYSLGMIIADDPDSLKLHAQGLTFGDIVLYCLCIPCYEKAKELAEEAYPLVLVEGGELVPEEEVAFAVKYNRPVFVHTGAERTAAQLRMRENAERVCQNIWRYLEQENQKPDSPVFLRHRKGS
jgi:hypothetical protein